MAARDETDLGEASLLDRIGSRCGVDLRACSQCRKCSAGCSVASATDWLPHALVRMVQLGLDEEALASHALWLCVSCQTCTTRCPNGIDLAAAIDAMRQLLLEAGIEPAEKDVHAFFAASMDTVRRHGRMHELGTVARLKLRTGGYGKDVGMGLALLFRGKLRVLPSRVKDRRALAALFAPSRDRARDAG
jgi:heterodisulfide reductase subunit C